MRKIISVLTATRAEYGLLKPLIKKLDLMEKFDVRVVVTGMHLSIEHGSTLNEIKNDGIKIDKEIEILMASDTAVSISKSMGLAMISFAEYFSELKPNLLVVLGDRYETLAVCCAAVNSQIPIAHLHGGETTEGAVDEAFRHSITKMSCLHFTSTETYRRRVLQLGEHPQQVFNVGAIGVEIINNLEYMTKEEFEKSINMRIKKKLALLTFHPVTLESNTGEGQLINILEALNEFDDLQVIITKANADLGGRAINKLIDEYVEQRGEKFVAFASLGQRRYLSAIKYCDFVIGNSSSGIIEVPTFKKPTINIGDRQKGRVQAKSIINCEPMKPDIIDAVNKALSNEFIDLLNNLENPYGKGNTSYLIVSEIINFFKDEKFTLKKHFYDLIGK